MERKTTTKWQFDDMRLAFGLQRILEGCELLDSWLDVENNLPPDDVNALERLRLRMVLNAEDWSEETLKMRFLAFLLDMADYDTDNYQSFFESSISAKVGDYTLSVKADFMVAKGVGSTPRVPYFCFHEYKRNPPDKDPRAQLFQAMLIAQAKNGNTKPIYGSYIIGKHWTFIVLQANNVYCTSRTYDATLKHDLQNILLILRKFKWILDNQLL